MKTKQRKLRKLIPVVLASLLYPVAGYPLGLGEIRLHSGLNQPLSAEIDLLSVSSEDAASLTAGLASSEVFAQLGLDRSSSLMLVQFDVKQRKDGSYYVKVSSKQPIRETYLDFLLEVNWRSGRSLREYTVLLDPPDFADAPPAAVQPPSLEMAESPDMGSETDQELLSLRPGEEASASDNQEGGAFDATVAANETDRQDNERAGTKPDTVTQNRDREGQTGEEQAGEEGNTEPKSVRDSNDANKESVPAKAVASAAVIPEAPVAAPAKSGIVTYGPVKRGEVLWKIATRIRSNDHSVTLQQVMIALVRSNPRAFFGRNINRLKAGQVLRFDPEQLAAISRAEAVREVALQGREWAEFKQRAAVKAARRSPTGASGSQGTAAVASVKKDEPRLKLVAPQEGGKADKKNAAAPGAVGKNPDALRNDLMVAIETSEALKQENKDLRARKDQLQAQLNSMQRLLSLKDNELAALQRQAADANAKKSAAAGKGNMTQPPSVAVAPQAQPADAGKQAAAVATQPQASADASKAQSPASATAQSGAAKQKGANTKASPPPAPEPPPDQVTQIMNAIRSALATVTELAKPALAAVQETFKSVKPTLDKVVAATLAAVAGNELLAGLGLSLIATAGLGFFWMRRRRSGAGFQESILMGASPSMLKGKAGEKKPSEETSFFSDFAVSGMGDIHAEDSEVDPLTEADVYMAYQRFQQAEELLKESMKNHDRPELHVKLLEVYHATRDTAAFEAEAARVSAMLGGRGPLWEKVLALGRDLLPEHSMFAAATTSAPNASHADARLDNEVLDIGLDLDALTAGSMEQAPSSASDFNLDLGMDFSDLESQSGQGAPASAMASAASPQTDQSLEFDLGSLGLDLGESPSAAHEPSHEPSVEASSFDLGEMDLGGLGMTEAPAEDLSAHGGLAGGADSGELDLGGLDLGNLSLDQPVEEAAPASLSEGLDLGGLGDLSFEQPTETADASLSDGFDLGEMELGNLSAETSTVADFAPVSGLSGGFELTEVDLDSSSAEVALEKELAPDSGLSDGFDLNDVDLNSPSAEMSLGEELVSDSGLSDGFDLTDVDLNSSSSEMAEVGDIAPGSGLTEFDLGDVDLNSIATEESTEASPANGAPSFGEGFDLSELEALSLDTSSGDDSDDSMFADMDEAGTKLDLARAYVEMGDSEGARSILDEVVMEGNLQQKQQAQELLHQIA